ncbi:MAG: glutamine phosphoribosylpyrophosphate amidotransferase [Chloroflexi bacterium]|nr:glutamine phosphoribosylpyrophosphate amidotransferase [Chloroflexota bacterium]
MCGIAGYLSKGDDPEPVGRIMLDMLSSLARRGPDSVGMALYRTEPGHRETCWIRLPEDGDTAAHERRILTGLAVIAEVGPVQRHEGLLRVELATSADAAAIRAAAEGGSRDVEIVSLGHQLELVKQVGHPDGLERAFNMSGFRGSHAIGHTRLSTESRVDLTHSQPFWARGAADVATVHNGHITNYHRLRRLYEQRGVRFFSENDSEVIGVYIADQLDRGLTLEEALESSLDDFDGSFTYLVASGDAMGYARDPFALKPLIVVETDRYVAVANEEIAIRAALGTAGVAHEPSGHVFKLWRRSQLAAPVAAA